MSVASYQLCMSFTNISVVETPFLLPNCNGSDLLDVYRLRCLITIRSSSLATRHVRDMGLMSFSMRDGGDFFGKVVTIARFHFSGKYPSLIELLNIAVMGGARIGARSQSIQAWILMSLILMSLIPIYESYSEDKTFCHISTFVESDYHQEWAGDILINCKIDFIFFAFK